MNSRLQSTVCSDSLETPWLYNVRREGDYPAGVVLAFFSCKDNLLPLEGIETDMISSSLKEKPANVLMQPVSPQKGQSLIVKRNKILYNFRTFSFVIIANRAL